VAIELGWFGVVLRNELGREAEITLRSHGLGPDWLFCETNFRQGRPAILKNEAIALSTDSDIGAKLRFEATGWAGTGMSITKRTLVWPGNAGTRKNEAARAGVGTMEPIFGFQGTIPAKPARRKGAIQMILRKTPDDANRLNCFENSAGRELERCGGEGQEGEGPLFEWVSEK